MRRYIHQIFERYGWLLTGVICLLIGYMLVWQRGMYLDDYSIRNAAFSDEGEWKAPFDQSSNPLSPARSLTWEVTPRLAALLPTHELYVRGLTTAFIGLNGLLLGLFIGRLLNSRFAAVICGWLFLMPTFTNATLWVGAVTYIFSATLALTFLHLFWSALTNQTHYFFWTIAGSITIALMLLFGEGHVAIIAMAGMFGLIWALSQPASLLQRIIRLSYALITPIITFSIIFTTIIHNPSAVSNRGGIATDLAAILERSSGFLHDFLFWTVMPGWGQQTTVEAFRLGLATITNSWQTLILSLLAAFVMFLTIMTWPRTQSVPDSSIATGILAAIGGVVWLIVIMSIPLSLAQYRIYYDSRFAYLPLAGIPILAAATAWCVARLTPGQTVERMCLSITGVMLLLATATTVGMARMYEARNNIDSDQLADLARAVPADILPTGAIIIPVNLDEQLPDVSVNIPFGTGVFEAPWAACASLREIYDRDDLLLIGSNRWVPLTFNYTQEPSQDYSISNISACANPWKPSTPSWPSIDETDLLINGAPVPLDRAVLFTYREGKVFSIESLTIEYDDGSSKQIALPIGDSLARRGLPTIDTISVQNTPAQ
jgi:hypothetical protein